MKENKSNWLYVEFGSRGEREVIEWRKDKSFKEIEERGKDDYDEGIDDILEGGEMMKREKSVLIILRSFVVIVVRKE